MLCTSLFKLSREIHHGTAWPLHLPVAFAESEAWANAWALPGALQGYFHVEELRGLLPAHLELIIPECMSPFEGSRFESHCKGMMGQDKYVMMVDTADALYFSR